MKIIPTPPFVTDIVPVHGKRDASYFVLHTTEGGGTIESLCKYFRESRDVNGNKLQYGVTFITEPSGRMGKVALLDAETWHVQNHNSDCIGLEQIGYSSTTNAAWRSKYRMQLAAAAWIIAWWSQETHHPILAAGSDKTGRSFTHSAGVTQHKWVPQNDHGDCGSGYPFDDVLAKAKRYQTNGIPRITQWRLKRKK